MADADASNSEATPLVGGTLSRVLATGFTVLLVGAGAVFVHYRSVTRARVLEDGEEVSFVIPEDAAWSSIVERLQAVDLVEYRWYFEVWARRRGLPKEVGAGSFRLEGPLGWPEMAKQLSEGGTRRDVRVVFPEGWTIYHMADRLDAVGLVSRQAFLEAATDPELLEKWGLPGESFEGYLFPDTYRFRPDPSAAAVVRRLHRRWREIWGEVAEGHRARINVLREKFGLDRHDFVTVASIVESETSVDAERPVIARVVYNRLDASMRLQMDPTCVYGPETYRATPSPEICKDPDNRYSTYVNDGLPPGPIANPGRASLRAAVDPSDDPKSADYLFYVARRDGTGRHHFSESYREHRRAVERFLK